ncbi:UNVERIFIED_ORG: hypothetical protein ABRZ91_001792 [Heyndrickxia coagulans]
MNKYEPQIMEWIANHFDLSAITVEDFPALPAGKRIIDNTGAEMAIFWDIFKGQVKEIFPN